MNNITQNLLAGLTAALIFFGAAASLSAQGSPAGIVAGQIVDENTGDPLIGVNVYLKGTIYGTATDFEGNYRIKRVPAGLYTLTVTYIGYETKEITGVEIKPNEVSTFNIAMSREVLEGEVVTVTAEALKNTEAALLNARQKATAVSDAISAEAISKTGSGDAASAMKKVTGASVIDGKYIYVRGLGERYSMTALNGMELPSADPDKKSFQMDLFPAGLLDNIVTLKTFTPDKPGTFSGGLVDINIKDFPEKLMIQFSTSAAYNSQTTFNDHFILPNSGGTDWLGMDDGTRDIPSYLQASDVEIPRYSSVTTREQALTLDRLSKSFNNTMSPLPADAPLNQGMSLAIGDQFQVANHQFGFLSSLSWGQSYEFYDNGEVGRWNMPGPLDDVEGLDPQYLLTDVKGSHQANWGGTVKFSYQNPKIGHLNASYLRTQSGESTARYLSGFWKDIPTTATLETRILSYVERNLNTFQFTGKHRVLGAQIEWCSSLSSNEQVEPDQRYFSNHYTVKQSTGAITYMSPASLYPPPIRYYRNLDESNYSHQIDMIVPFQVGGEQAKIKFGGNYTDIDREYNQRRFEYEEDGISYKNYGPDVNSYFEVVGIIDSSDADPANWVFGNVIGESRSLKNYFTGEQTTLAGYGMIDLPVMMRLRFIGGLRVENTEMIGQSADTTEPKGELKNTDFLPSANFVYQLTEKMNLRFAYTHTLARPTFRELAPYTNFEFQGDFSFQGNANLKRTLIRNVDLRWEWFINPGEITAVSLFYKNFENPIEKFLDDTKPNMHMSVTNVDKAIVYGIEFEARKELTDIHRFLRGINIGTNFSWARSEADIPEKDLFTIRVSDPDASTKRPFQGQSPYLFNLDLSYDNYAYDLNMGIYYNIFGDRLSIVTKGASPDVFERGYATVDTKISKGLFDFLTLSFTAKNILNPKITFSQELKGEEFIYHSYQKGVIYSLALSAKL